MKSKPIPSKKEKKQKKSIQNIVAVEEPKHHLDEYLDKVDDGENVAKIISTIVDVASINMMLSAPIRQR